MNDTSLLTIHKEIPKQKIHSMVLKGKVELNMEQDLLFQEAMCVAGCLGKVACISQYCEEEKECGFLSKASLRRANPLPVQSQGCF